MGLANARLVIACVVFIGFPALAEPAAKKGPDCRGGWPTNMAQGALKNDGLLRNDEIDFEKTTTVRLASEQTAKDLWHQVYLVTFSKKSGGSVQAIVVHDASMEECSMSGVQVFAVSKRLE